MIESLCRAARLWTGIASARKAALDPSELSPLEQWHRADDDTDPGVIRSAFEAPGVPSWVVRAVSRGVGVPVCLLCESPSARPGESERDVPAWVVCLGHNADSGAITRALRSRGFVAFQYRWPPT